MIRRTVLWLIAAALGIVASAAVAWAASQLAGQRIGLSSAPPSVMRGLAPRGSSGAMRSLPALGTARSPAGRGDSRPPAEDSGASRGHSRVAADDSAGSGGDSRPPADDSGGSPGRESTGPDD